MKKILKYLNQGKLGLFTFLYFPFAVVEIAAVLNISSGTGWIAVLLGAIVCFPWLYIGHSIMDVFGLRPNDYFQAMLISSVLINMVLLYFIDGARNRSKQNKSLTTHSSGTPNGAP